MLAEAQQLPRPRCQQHGGRGGREAETSIIQSVLLLVMTGAHVSQIGFHNLTPSFLFGVEDFTLLSPNWEQMGGSCSVFLAAFPLCHWGRQGVTSKPCSQPLPAMGRRRGLPPHGQYRSFPSLPSIFRLLLPLLFKHIT